jgi:arylsulfatase A-like enzyme
MKRRALLVLGLALYCGDGAREDVPVRPRNVLLISIDTVRPDRLSCYGYGRPTSPAIDALAARGVRFADASSAAPWTLPSHATMFTGLYPSHHGVKAYTHKLPAESVTLAEILRSEGFETFAVVSTWNIADRRFEIFQGFDSDDVRYIPEIVASGQGKVAIVNNGTTVAKEAKAFLDGRDRSVPFFLFAHFYDAHSDYTPTEKSRARFVRSYDGSVTGTTQELLALRDKPRQLGPNDLRYLTDLYDAEIHDLDDVLAGFLAFLEEEGLDRDTLIVLTSDHGEEFGEHGGLLHARTQYDELLRVPLIMVGPGIPSGAVVAEPVSLVDLLPTILGRLGIRPRSRLDGVDLAPAWSGGRLPDRVLFGEADQDNFVDGKKVIDIKRMARNGREKLHLDRHTERVQLFDLSKDPHEQTDLATAAAGRVAVLRGELSRFLDGVVPGQTSGTDLSPEDVELLRKLGYAAEGEHE